MNTSASVPGDQLTGVIDSLVETYRSIGTINHLEQRPLPSTQDVVAIAEDLRELLFPGYCRRQNLCAETVRFFCGEMLHHLRGRLAEQILRALRHTENRSSPAQQRDKTGSGKAGAEEAARQKTDAFLGRLPHLRALLAADVQAAYDGDPAAASFDEIIFCYPGLLAVSVYRMAHELHRLEVPFIPRILTEWAHSRTGIDIHPGARIGPSFFIDHGTGVVIGETTQIASHVRLYQGVTLGAINFPRDAQGNLIRNQKRHPTIEDHVVIYSNASVLGGNTVVGRHAVIGAGVTLTRSVPPHTVVTLEKPALRFRAAA